MANEGDLPFIQAGSYPVRHGNSVRSLVDGIPAFRRICEAIDTAQRSAWATVTFMWPSFVMPDQRGTAFDVLQRAVDRGVDVRLIFWRPDSQTETYKRNAFWGSDKHFEVLVSGRYGFGIRWDRAEPGFCQHQKTWLIDAGEKTEVAFVGGINLNPHSVTSPGHGGANENHDIFAELSGPSTVDVHHNFVQRWNESSERLVPDGRWGRNAESDLPFPNIVPARTGPSIVQIQRTTHRGRYTNGRASPGASSFAVAEGEQSIFDQYCAAIGAAQSAIYIENQYLEVQEIVDELRHALKRGVEVVLVMPVQPDFPEGLTTSPEKIAFWDQRADLANYHNFTLAGLAGLGTDGVRHPVCVHAKIMLIDDAWATIGSCNLHRASLFGNGELNAAISDADFVRAMRSELFQEHVAEDTSGMDPRSALQLFGTVAGENRRRLGRNNPDWQGLAFTLDLASYGRQSQI
jgi:phosphatidylserine/phosphatidylglycerophosphate/cardiolipin synthase-like enzyme